MGLFFARNFDLLWMGYLDQDYFEWKGILLESNFDIYQLNKSSLKTSGALQRYIQLQGSYTPLFQQDQNKLGLRVFKNFKIEIPNVDTKQPKGLFPSF